MAVLAVPAGHPHVVVAGCGEPGLGRCDDVVVDVDGRHVPVRARQVREERRVVARARAELITERRFSHPRIEEVLLPFTIMDVPVRDKEIGPHRHLDAVYAARPLTADIVLDAVEAHRYRSVPVADVAFAPGAGRAPRLIAAVAEYAVSITT